MRNRLENLLRGVTCRHEARSAVAVDSPSRAAEESKMFDVLMIALGLGFFALSIGYAYACERL